LVTALGAKASTDSVILIELCDGNRVSFVKSQHKAAIGLIIAGITMEACSPVILKGGVLLSMFGG